MADFIASNGQNDPGVDLKTNGKVGIGTTSPRSKLHIESTSSADGMVTILNPSEGGEASLSFDTGSFDTTKRWVIGVGGWSNTDKFVIGRDTSPKVTVDTSGNVGIGITNPSQKLTVNGSVVIGSANDARIENGSSPVYGLKIGPCYDAGTNRHVLFGDWNSDTFDTKMVINCRNGNVGIGTTAPAARADIDGGAAVSGVANLSTSGSSVTVTTTNNAFVDVQVGATITANGYERIVIAKDSNTQVTVGVAIDWSSGFPFTYKNPLLRLANNGTTKLLIGVDGAFYGRPSGYIAAFQQDNSTGRGVVIRSLNHSSTDPLLWAYTDQDLGLCVQSNCWVGVGLSDPGSRLDIDGAFTLRPTTTPGNPTQNSNSRLYIRNNKLVIQFNDAGTIRYKYLDLTGTGATWTHTTTAP